MTAVQIAALIALAIISGRVSKHRPLVMLCISALAVFWLQPPEPFLSLLFWLPFATLAITVASWALTAAPEVRSWRQNWRAAVLLMAVAVVVDAGHYIHVGRLVLVPAPSLQMVLIVLAALLAGTHLLLRWKSGVPVWRLLAMVAIIAAFVVLKSPDVGSWMRSRLEGLRATGAGGAGVPLTWLGYSYLAFRLLHTIRDRQAGRLPSVTLEEYVNYAIFFPAFTSGPIDRLERFVQDLRTPAPLCNDDWLEAGRRILLGLFKKFVIADLLAVISINDALVSRVQAGGWLWVFLYAYALRIYFDFSGYTDLAIGMGRLIGVKLPENFAAPYLKPNIGQFWNSWHMTLTQWFRAYVFNPMTRAFRSMRTPPPTWLIILVTQITTMALIGLWHGITWGFVVWGLWHAAGLFVHNRWNELTRSRAREWMQRPWAQRAASAVGVFLTFNYVALGWLFFTLSSPAVALLAMRKLFGFA
ncbi:MAG TPA: MBOAT family O-acyltransferase [Anaerolineales bacterium]